MPRACCALGIAEGQVREIAVLSRVGKPTCFVVTDIDEESEPPTVWLSRTAVQLRAQEALLSSLSPGDIIPQPSLIWNPSARSSTSAASALSHRHRKPVGLAHLSSL